MIFGSSVSNVLARSHYEKVAEAFDGVGFKLENSENDSEVFQKCFHGKYNLIYILVLLWFLSIRKPSGRPIYIDHYAWVSLKTYSLFF